ncbi:unnamed protein product [Linum trigynum]|uniref:Uncharacterized protein n=1 Tax=Linum trigynum TaxID=586398 RepID=A0AAV2E7E4_9ROSI
MKQNMEDHGANQATECSSKMKAKHHHLLLLQQKPRLAQSKIVGQDHVSILTAPQPDNSSEHLLIHHQQANTNLPSTLTQTTT